MAVTASTSGSNLLLSVTLEVGQLYALSVPDYNQEPITTFTDASGNSYPAFLGQTGVLAAGFFNPEQTSYFIFNETFCTVVPENIATISPYLAIKLLTDGSISALFDAVTASSGTINGNLAATGTVSAAAGLTGNEVINYTQITDGSLSPYFDTVTTGSWNVTGNHAIAGDQVINGNLTVEGYISATPGASGNQMLAYEQVGDGSLNPVFNNVTSEGTSSLTNYQELQASVSSPATPGWVMTLNLGAGTVQVVTLNSSGTLAFVGLAPSGYACSVVLYLEQGASGGATVTWPANTLWSKGNPPVLSTAPGAIDVVTLVTYNGGSTWFGFLSGSNMSS